LIPKNNLNQTEEEVFESRVRFPRYYSIDGERYPIEPIQGRVLNKRLRVFCINNKIN
jgi:diacylglycerol kinase family enzyme